MMISLELLVEEKILKFNTSKCLGVWNNLFMFYFFIDLLCIYIQSFHVLKI